MEQNIKRDNIYVGTLKKFNKQIVSYYGTTYGEEHKDVITHWIPCRTVLFTVDEKGMAHDLLYDTEPCPVDTITSKYTLERRDPAICNPLSMKPLLRFFRYPEELDTTDIIAIRMRFFSPEFFRENCYLFGYKELKADDLIKKGLVDVHDEIEREIFKDQYQKVRDKGLQKFEFVATTETELPYEYFDRLRALAGIPVKSEYYSKISRDIFKPKLLKEGHVKQLIKK